MAWQLVTTLRKQCSLGPYFLSKLQSVLFIPPLGGSILPKYDEINWNEGQTADQLA